MGRIFSLQWDKNQIPSSGIENSSHWREKNISHWGEFSRKKIPSSGMKKEEMEEGEEGVGTGRKGDPRPGFNLRRWNLGCREGVVKDESIYM